MKIIQIAGCAVCLAGSFADERTAEDPAGEIIGKKANALGSKNASRLRTDHEKITFALRPMKPTKISRRSPPAHPQNQNSPTDTLWLVIKGGVYLMPIPKTRIHPLILVRRLKN